MSTNLDEIPTYLTCYVHPNIGEESGCVGLLHSDAWYMAALSEVLLNYWAKKIKIYKKADV